MAQENRTCLDCGQFHGEFCRFTAGKPATMWCALDLMVSQPLGERQDPDVLKIKVTFGKVCPKFDLSQRNKLIQSLIDDYEQ